MADIRYKIDFRQITGKLNYMGYKLKSVANDPDLRMMLYENVIYPEASLHAPEDTRAFVESPINPGGIYNVPGKRGYRVSTGYIDPYKGIYFGSYERRSDSDGETEDIMYNESDRSGIPEWSKELNFRMNRPKVKQRIAKAAIPYIVKELNNG